MPETRAARRRAGMLAASVLFACCAVAQTPAPASAHPRKPGDPTADAPAPSTPAPAAESKTGDARRIELNLLGKTDAAAGESRRNENIQFNLVDNNALKELNVRLGTTATIVPVFLPDRSYFGAEFGNRPAAPPHLASQAQTRGPAAPAAIHGSLFASHLNSIFSARSFFQVGDVKPARDNEYGFVFGAPLSRSLRLFIEGSQQKSRGSVNGNVLVPRADERTVLAADPATRAIVSRWLAAYPSELPNRTDVNLRALNTNAPQAIDSHNAGARLDIDATTRDRIAMGWNFTLQHVEAFQLVAGQNPDTDTRSHRARVTWSRQWTAATITDFTAGFDRIGSLLLPDEGAVGPMVSTSGLETLGPQGSIPIDRAQNLFRAAGQARNTRGRHTFGAGFNILRRQLNGAESDAHRGFYSFGADFGRDAVTNLRFGAAAMHILSEGNIHRGFRSWEAELYAGAEWRARPWLTVNHGLRYQPVTRPSDVTGLSTIPYGCDCNNVAPRLGLAARLPGHWGVLRGAYGVHFGEIFPATFQQVRFSPPGGVKLVVTAPASLIDPLGRASGAGATGVRGNLYLLDPELAVPYSYQYNASWEPDLSSTWASAWKLQFGYVGSRSHKLLVMWYLNRAHPVPGELPTTVTINQRRPNAALADVRWVLNGSRGYFDAARVTVLVPRWRGLSVDASYWFGKAMDLGSSYTNTAHDNDSRLGRSQSEFETHQDMKAVSSFDQTHAFLWRAAWEIPGAARLARLGWLARGAGGWTVSGIVLAKTGIPFNVVSGSDGPGFGNVDGNGSDRPNLLDPSVLGRSISHPDTSRRLLPRSAFSFMAVGAEQGNLGRNVFRRGGIRNVNASLSRTWTIGQEKRLGFRAESINLLNTPQFAEPGFELVNANFGQITNTLNDGRTFRFHLDFAW